MQVSVVIPNFNGKKLLEKNLPQVIKTCKDCEIIVVDDASTDDSVSFLKSKFPNIKIVKHEKNRRFAAACNSGVKAAQGEIVILLNSDVVPEKDFLKPLVKHFKNPKVFAVGCKEIEETNGKQIISGRTEAEFKRGFLIHWRPEDQDSQYTFWTFGGSMAVSKKKYLELGGMDEIYSPAYWEDFDLCYRAKKKGWLCLFEKDAVVYHHHETTNKSVFGQKKMQIMSYRNQIIFVWKNIKGKQLLQHFLWLPYHLVFTTIRSKGLFLIAFWQAIVRYLTYKND